MARLWTLTAIPRFVTDGHILSVRTDVNTYRRKILPIYWQVFNLKPGQLIFGQISLWFLIFTQVSLIVCLWQLFHYLVFCQVWKILKTLKIGDFWCNFMENLHMKSSNIFEPVKYLENIFMNPEFYVFELNRLPVTAI